MSLSLLSDRPDGNPHLGEASGEEVVQKLYNVGRSLPGAAKVQEEEEVGLRVTCSPTGWTRPYPAGIYVGD